MLHAKPTQFCQRYQKELINYLRVGGDPLGWVRGKLTFHPSLKGMQTMGNAFPVPTLCKEKVLCAKPTQFCQRYQKELMNYLREWGGSIGMGQGGADLSSFAKRDANNEEYNFSDVGCKIVSIIINNIYCHGALCNYLLFSFISILHSPSKEILVSCVSHTSIVMKKRKIVSRVVIQS